MSLEETNAAYAEYSSLSMLENISTSFHSSTSDEIEPTKRKKLNIQTTPFNKIRNNIARTINSTWTKERKNKAYMALDGGKAILTTQDHLDRYIYAFGAMHQAKLNSAFSTITNLDTLYSENIKIIDYGCGQGIGTILLLEYLLNFTKKTIISIDDITLIDPSKIALTQAQYYIDDCFPDLNKKLINKTINQLNENDLATNKNSIKFHIFSNILDINSFSLFALFDNINKTQSGQNYFVCVSPDYYSGNCRLDEFIAYFKKHVNCLIISERKVEIDNPSNRLKPWKDYEKVFKVIK